MNDTVSLTLPALLMLSVLVICCVAVLTLVVTLPAVRNFFRRLVHPRAGQAHPRTV